MLFRFYLLPAIWVSGVSAFEAVPVLNCSHGRSALPAARLRSAFHESGSFHNSTDAAAQSVCVLPTAPGANKLPPPGTIGVVIPDVRRFITIVCGPCGVLTKTGS